MTAKQKEAACTLGYDRESWDDMNVETPLPDIENSRYSKYLKMMDEGQSNDTVKRKMRIAGFTEKEIRALFNGDSVGPNAVPAPGVFSSLKAGSPVKQLRNIPTVLKNSLTNAMAMAELHHDEYASNSPSKAKGGSTSPLERKLAKAKTFREKQSIFDCELKKTSSKKSALQRKLRRTIDRKDGTKSPPSSRKKVRSPPTSARGGGRFSPKRDFDRRVAESKRNDLALGHVESELARDRAVLSEKMDVLIALREEIEGMDDQMESDERKMRRLLKKLKQMLVLVLRKRDGGHFTKEAQDAIAAITAEPLNTFYVENKDVHEYILSKMESMGELFETWPPAMEESSLITGEDWGGEDDEGSNNPYHYVSKTPPRGYVVSGGGDEEKTALTESQRILEQTGFSNWSQREIDAVLRSTPGHLEGAAKPGEVETITGVYRQHIVAEPPQRATKYTRTVQIETSDGEFFMLGVYHHVSGIRQESEIQKFNNKIVRVTGIKHDRSPPNPGSKFDILAPITPYIGEIRSVEIAYD